MPFHILSLSGGGYRGLFTVEVLARLERDAGRPIGECFDLIAGTSIGGIVAIGLAMGKTAEEIRQAFHEEGEHIFPNSSRPTTKLGRFVAECRSFFKGAKYESGPLRRTIVGIVGENAVIGDARTRLLIPTVNLTKGSVQMFKTPHHEALRADRTVKAVDVAMATSAAPLFFPLARIGGSLFADGGLAANAPDACAIHEAIHFAGQSCDDLRVLSVGTTVAPFGIPSSVDPDFGGREWLRNERLVSTTFGVQQQLVDYMVRHRLGPNYVRIDRRTSAEQASDVGLDLATRHTRVTLVGLAEAAYQEFCAHPGVKAALAHRPSTPDFVQSRMRSAAA